MSTGHAASGMILVILLYILVVVGICIALAFIPSNIAKKKGYSAGGFWAFGFFAFLPALIVSLCIPDRSTPAVVQPVVVQSNTADELKKYADLLKEGAITQEEYDAIKAKLI